LAQGRPVRLLQFAELSQDQPLLDGGEYRLDQRSLGQTGLLPLGDQDLADRPGWPEKLTTMAGRFLRPVWSVKGKGTRTRSPNL